jgi:hypothetical protein
MGDLPGVVGDAAEKPLFWAVLKRVCEREGGAWDLPVAV